MDGLPTGLPGKQAVRRIPSETRTNGAPSLYTRAKYSVIRQAPGRLPAKRIVQPVAAIMISLKKSPFISYVEEHFFEDGWSLDICVHRALKDGFFTREQIVCTKTLVCFTSTNDSKRFPAFCDIHLLPVLVTTAAFSQRTGTASRKMSG